MIPKGYKDLPSVAKIGPKVVIEKGFKDPPKGLTIQAPSNPTTTAGTPPPVYGSQQTLKPPPPAPALFIPLFHPFRGQIHLNCQRLLLLQAHRLPKVQLQIKIVVDDKHNNLTNQTCRSSVDWGSQEAQ